MTDEIAAMVLEQKDRQDIYDCIMRYCRGVDRLDRDMLLSAYHPDGIDDHGYYVGPVQGFADYALNLHRTEQQQTLHHVTNHHCVVGGDTAHAETYFLFYGLNTVAPLYALASGRYLDRFEKRSGRWGIAERICMVDIRNELWAPTGHEGDELYMPSRRDRTDPSYIRPLHVDRGRFTVS